MNQIFMNQVCNINQFEESEVGSIRIQNLDQIRPGSNLFVLIRIENLFRTKAIYYLSDAYLADTFFHPSHYHINWTIQFKLWVIR